MHANIFGIRKKIIEIKYQARRNRDVRTYVQCRIVHDKRKKKTLAFIYLRCANQSSSNKAKLNCYDSPYSTDQGRNNCILTRTRNYIVYQEMHCSTLPRRKIELLYDSSSSSSLLGIQYTMQTSQLYKTLQLTDRQQENTDL